MRFLLDTHVWIWAFEGSASLGKRCREVLRKSNAERYVSPVSTLEISRLVSRREIVLTCPLQEWIRQSFVDLRMETLALDHPTAIEAYELIGGFHADPADRMLVAAARVHSCCLVTADARILAYPHVKTLNARA